MEVKEAINKLLSNDTEILNLVKGKFREWDNSIKAKIASLNAWKDNFLSAGIGLKKYKGVIF